MADHPPVFVLLENWYAVDEHHKPHPMKRRIPYAVVGPFATTALANAWSESWQANGWEPEGLPVARWGWLALLSPERANELASERQAENKRIREEKKSR